MYVVNVYTNVGLVCRPEPGTNICIDTGCKDCTDCQYESFQKVPNTRTRLVSSKGNTRPNTRCVIAAVQGSYMMGFVVRALEGQKTIIWKFLKVFQALVQGLFAEKLSSENGCFHYAIWSVQRVLCFVFLLVRVHGEDYEEFQREINCNERYQIQSE